MYDSPFNDSSYKPKKVNISSEEKAILKRFHEMYDTAYTAKQPIKKIMDDSYLAFRSILSDFSSRQRDVTRLGPAIFVPYTFQAVVSIQAQLNGRPPQYRLSQTSPGDEKRIAADVVSKLSAAEFKRSKAMNAFASAVQTSLIFGTAPLRSRYRYDKKTRKFLKGISEDGEMEFKKDTRVMYSGWSVDMDHPLKAYLPAVHTSNPQELPFYIYRDLVDVRLEYQYYKDNPAVAYKNNYEALCRGMGDLRDDMEILFSVDPLYRTSTTRYGASSPMQAIFGSGAEKQAINKEYLVEKFWVYDQVNCCWTIIIGDRVMQHHPNPLDSGVLPVELVRDYKVENSIWGIGEPQLLRYLQMEANALHTLVLDSTNYTSAGVYGVNPAGLKNPRDLSVYPGKIFEMKNIPNLTIDSVVQSLHTGDVKPGAFRMMEANSDLVNRTLGTGSAIIGGDPINPTSATESNNLKAAASTRIYERARMMEQENLVNVIEHQLEFMSQMYDEELIAKVTDEEFIKFIPGNEADVMPEDKALVQADGFSAIVYSSDIREGFDIIVEGESTLPISRQERRVEGMQLLKIAAEQKRPPTAEELAKDPMIPQKFPNGLPILDAQKVAERIVLPSFSSVSDVSDLLWEHESHGPMEVKRGVGRPEDVLNPNNIPTASQVQTTEMQSAAQPNNLGVNASERMESYGASNS